MEIYIVAIYSFLGLAHYVQGVVDRDKSYPIMVVLVGQVLFSITWPFWTAFRIFRKVG